MAIHLRPHHLLCMLTFIGKGYTPAFVANLEQVVRRLSTGTETIEIVAGPDDICAPLLAGCGALDAADCHCHRASVLERDRLATESIAALLSRSLTPCTHLRLTPADLDQLRTAFAAGTIRQACTGCQWKPLCDQIAADNFTATLLVTPTSPTKIPLSINAPNK